MCVTSEVENDQYYFTVLDCSGLTRKEVASLSSAEMLQLMMREGVGSLMASNPKTWWILTKEELDRCLYIQESGLIEGNIRLHSAKDTIIMKEIMGEDTILYHQGL